MQSPKLYDVVKLRHALPHFGLAAGSRGCIVEQFSPDVFMVEFVEANGVTLALETLSTSQFVVCPSLTATEKAII